MPTWHGGGGGGAHEGKNCHVRELIGNFVRQDGPRKAELRSAVLNIVERVLQGWRPAAILSFRRFSRFSNV